MTTQDLLINIPGGEVFVRKWVPEKILFEDPIFLLHDSLGCVELWRHFPEVLASSLNIQVIAYDRLGFGKSTIRRSPPSFSFIDEEAEIYFPEILNTLGIKRFSLFGHSVGGEMSVAFAANQNLECKYIITESAQAFIEEQTLHGVVEAKKKFQDEEQFNKLKSWHGERAKWVLDAWTEIWLDPEFAEWNLRSYLEKVTCPVLAIHGELDEFGSVEFPKYIVNGVKGPAQLEIMKNIGHVPHREAQERVVKVVKEFVEKYGRA